MCIFRMSESHYFQIIYKHRKGEVNLSEITDKVDAIFARDFPMIQGVVLFLALVFLASNLLVDILYAFLDPRIHYG